MPLHEMVLDALYLKNVTGPQAISTEEALLEMGHPTLALYQVKQVLEWLRVRGDVEYRFSKYLLTQATFLELKGYHDSHKKKLTPTAKIRRKEAQVSTKNEGKARTKIEKKEPTISQQQVVKRPKAQQNKSRKIEEIHERTTHQEQQKQVKKEAVVLPQQKSLKTRFQKWWRSIKSNSEE